MADLCRPLRSLPIRVSVQDWAPSQAHHGSSRAAVGLSETRILFHRYCIDEAFDFLVNVYVGDGRDHTVRQKSFRKLGNDSRFQSLVSGGASESWCPLLPSSSLTHLLSNLPSPTRCSLQCRFVSG